MKNLADTTELIEKTTSTLMEDEKSLSAQTGVDLIDKWIDPLSENENTQPIAAELRALRELLVSDPTASEAIKNQMETVALKVVEITPDIGAEGEMPALLAGLSTALRMGGDHAEKQ